MIDFTDYYTYLYGFMMLTLLYFGYEGAYSRQTHYKPEYRYTQNKAIWGCVLNTIFVGCMHYASYNARNELIQAGSKTISLTELDVWFAFWYSYFITVIIGAYRGAKKLNEEDT